MVWTASEAGWRQETQNITWLADGMKVAVTPEGGASDITDLNAKVKDLVARKLQPGETFSWMDGKLSVVRTAEGVTLTDASTGQAAVYQILYQTAAKPQ